MVGVRRGNDRGRRQETSDEQDGRRRQEESAQPMTVHAGIVREQHAPGNTSVVPTDRPRGPVPIGTAPELNLSAGATICCG
jgi:hypothetical protein